ncbi:MAG: AAA family ATPase [Nanoarchaeota archaeon]
MIDKKIHHINREVTSLKKEINLVKRNFHKKFDLIITELQKLGYGYEVVLDPESVQDYYANLIEKINPKKTFKDVILGEEIKTQLSMALSQIKNHNTLMHKWGLKNIQEGNAISLIFSGPSGTGKTLTAEALSNELRKKLFIVRYSNLIDSYVGETGKNIVKVFDMAKKSDAILFFDEADAIASTRTTIFSATDSETNLTKNILLKELEKFDGIVIFATNLASNFDKAFERRINLHITFKIPDIQEREGIWKLLSKTLPLGKNVKFYELAKEFEFSGGHIKNSIINAARLAVANNSNQVLQEHFVKAAKFVREGRNILLNFENNDKDSLNYLG